MNAARLGTVVAWIAASTVPACRPPPAPVATVTPPAGVSIAVYRLGDQHVGLIDDRRWVEVTAGELVIDDVDASAPLASLAITPLGTSDLEIGACARDRVELTAAPGPPAGDEPEGDDDGELARSTVVLAPIRCAVRGRQGRHLVRVVYVAPELGYRALHEVTMVASDRATVSTRYAIATPRHARSGLRASITLYRGVPGGTRPRLELARGEVALDGSIATIATRPRAVDARVVRVFGGPGDHGSSEEEDDDDDDLGILAPGRSIWVWLELDGLRLAPGAIHALIATPSDDERHAEVGAGRWFQVGDDVRAPLWIDEQMRGTRRRTRSRRHTDRFAMSVANLGEVSREVWIEQAMRDGKRGVVRAGWPTKPELIGRIVRARVVVEPYAIKRAVFEVTYKP